MMRGYQIEQGVVTNVVVVPDHAVQSASGLSWGDGGLANGDGKTWILSEAGGVGWSLVDGALVAPSVEPASIDLATVKDELTDRIDRDAEAVRSRYITTGAGQAMAYIEKASQAKAYLAATDPVDADYPLLVAEVGITGETVAEVATVIDTMQQQWMATCAQIEPIRIGAKEQIKSAETAAAAHAVYDAIEWPVAE